jgi:surfeit locus 1 family protein
MATRSPAVRLLRQPRWLAGHALVLVTVVLFASLGLWQLDRLAERRAYNALLTERMAQEPIGSAEAAAEGADTTAYRRFTATGAYRHEAEVLLSTRSLDGRPGHHVLTPLETPAGVVVVNRGWVPLEEDAPPVEAAAPPAGEVRVTGLLFPGFEARRSGALDGGAGRLQFVSDVDLDVLREATGLPLLDVWVLAERQEPGQPGPLPVTAEPPPLTEGSHLSYAAQWFLFALVVVVGYPLLLRRTYRDEQADGGSRVPAPRDRSEPPVPAA